MDYCPYSNARWHCRNPRRSATGDDVALNVRLENSDDIMPADYNVANVCENIGIIASGVKKISRKYPKYVSTGGPDWKSQGSLSQIISCTKGNLRCPTWPLLGQISLTAEKHDRFWSAETLSDPEAYMGVIYMLGEIDETSLNEPKCVSYRSQKTVVVRSLWTMSLS